MGPSKRLSLVLDVIKRFGPISAVEIGKRLDISEKQARSAIDRLRPLGEPIWNNKARQLFAWSDKSPLGEGWRLPGSVSTIQMAAARPTTSAPLQSHRTTTAVSEGRRRRSTHPISPQMWQTLVAASKQAQWSQPGVFATAEGTNFERCGSHSLLYVGQSMGALGERLNLGLNQAENAERTRSWMENWRVNNPRSSFWQVADNLASPKELAWTNIVKIDVPAAQDSRRGRPPQQGYWQAIAGYLIGALAEEIDQLRPRVTLFVTGAYCREIVETALETCDYSRCVSDEVGKIAIDARLWRSAENRWAVHVRHPQGTTSEWRDSLAEIVHRLRR